MLKCKDLVAGFSFHYLHILHHLFYLKKSFVVLANSTKPLLLICLLVLLTESFKDSEFLF